MLRPTVRNLGSGVSESLIDGFRGEVCGRFLVITKRRGEVLIGEALNQGVERAVFGFTIKGGREPLMGGVGITLSPTSHQGIDRLLPGLFVFNAHGIPPGGRGIHTGPVADGLADGISLDITFQVETFEPGQGGMLIGFGPLADDGADLAGVVLCNPLAGEDARGLRRVVLGNDVDDPAHRLFPGAA